MASKIECVTFTQKIDKDIKKYFDDYAETHDLSKGRLLETILREHFKLNKEKK